MTGDGLKIQKHPWEIICVLTNIPQLKPLRGCRVCGRLLRAAAVVEGVADRLLRPQRSSAAAVRCLWAAAPCWTEENWIPHFCPRGSSRSRTKWVGAAWRWKQRSVWRRFPHSNEGISFLFLHPLLFSFLLLTVYLLLRINGVIHLVALKVNPLLSLWGQWNQECFNAACWRRFELVLGLRWERYAAVCHSSSLHQRGFTTIRMRKCHRGPRLVACHRCIFGLPYLPSL